MDPGTYRGETMWTCRENLVIYKSKKEAPEKTAVLTRDHRVLASKPVRK